MKGQINWTWILIFIGIAIIYFLTLKGCIPSPFAKLASDTIRSVLTIDTTKGQVIINNTWSPSTSIRMPENQQSKDTIVIYRDYYVERQYDTSFVDSVISGNVKLSVSENKLKSFSLTYKAVSRTNTITLREAKTWHVSAGAYLGGKDAKDWGGMAIYRDKGDRSFMASYSLQDKSFRLGCALKIK